MLTPLRALTKLSNYKLDQVNKKMDDSDTKSRREETQAIVNWISPLSFHTTHHSILESVQPGNGSWFLQHNTYRKWLNGEIDMLWCPGIRKSQLQGEETFLIVP